MIEVPTISRKVRIVEQEDGRWLKQDLLYGKEAYHKTAHHALDSIRRKDRQLAKSGRMVVTTIEWNYTSEVGRLTAQVLAEK